MNSKILKQKRELYGLSQRELGDLISMPRKVISNLENDKSVFTCVLKSHLTFVFNKLEQDKKLNELILRWEVEFIKAKYNPNLNGHSPDNVPSLKNVRKFLDGLKEIIDSSH